MIEDPDEHPDDDGADDARVPEGDGHQDEELSEEEAPEVVEPTTRQAFNALRSKFKSILRLCNISTLILSFSFDCACWFLHHWTCLYAEYSSHLTAESKGQMEMLAFARDRANGVTWYSTIVKLLQRLTSETTVDMLRLTPASSHVRDFQELEHDPELQRELQLLAQYADLSVQVASNRAWSQAFYGYAFPYCLARLLDQDPDSEVLGRKLADGILHLEQLIEENSKKKGLKDLLLAVGTNFWLVTREAFVCGCNKGWNVHSNIEMKDMCFGLFGEPNNTKSALENTFSSVEDTCTSPYAKEGGLPQLELTQEDFAEYIQSGGRTKPIPAFYDLHKHSIAEVVPRPQQIVSEARKASHVASANSAAAAALILHCVDNGFDCISDAWAGSLGKHFQNFAWPIEPGCVRDL